MRPFVTGGGGGLSAVREGGVDGDVVGGDVVGVDVDGGLVDGGLVDGGLVGAGVVDVGLVGAGVVDGVEFGSRGVDAGGGVVAGG